MFDLTENENEVNNSPAVEVVDLEIAQERKSS